MRKTVMGMAACAALAACGGGGGSSDGGSSGGASGTAVALNTSNYEVAANEVVASGLNVTDLAGDANIVTGAVASTQPNWTKLGWQQWLAARSAWNGTPTLGDPSGCVYGIALTFGFQSFTAASNGSVATANGQIALSSTRTACSTGTDSLTASTFTESLTAAGATRTRTLTGYSANVALTPTQSTTTLAGTIASTALDGGSLTIATPTPFVRAYNTEAYPHAGVGVATGANGGKVTVTALSNTTVRIDLDSNGDGTTDASVTKPWSTFE